MTNCVCPFTEIRLSDAVEDDNNMDATPLRLIDVEAIIRNRNAGGVVFTRQRRWHVISHTWSADVRKLSDIIGERLRSAAARTAQWPEGGEDDPVPVVGQYRSYEKLFETARFEKESSYQKLVKFLIILRSDGVRWVWFDAVCINQQDKKEKEREIEQMGMYYERSVGCHVVHHGIGRGFEVLLRADEEDDHGEVEEKESMLPRWFSRAWTFQEWILPPKITFVMDLATMEQILARAAHAILLNEYERDQSCSCCFFETSLSPSYVRSCMMKHPYVDATTASYEGSAKVEIREDDADLASLPKNRTSKCCRLSINEPHFRRIPNRRSWYFADDLGFAFLVRVKLQMKKLIIIADDSYNLSRAKEKEMALSDEEYELTRRMEIKGYFRGESDYSITKEKKIRLTIEEMQVRNCSNPEDRVLSVLKMLGVEGVMQVRSGKSLEEQIINLARIFLQQQQDDATLLQLCLVDGFGNETRGMSWAPHFEVKKGSWQAAAQLQELAGTRFDVDGQTLVYLCARITCAAAAAPVADPGGVAVSRSNHEYACVLEIAGVETSMHGSACIAFPVLHATSNAPLDQGALLDTSKLVDGVTMGKALARPEASLGSLWKQAMEFENQSLLDSGTWKLVLAPPERKLVT
ncbi:hypothetical protein L7F22_025238 [Adiantum nelumboides]|nr:hypothetical protein [Adiantum nelumboides]